MHRLAQIRVLRHLFIFFDTDLWASARPRLDALAAPPSPPLRHALSDRLARADDQAEPERHAQQAAEGGALEEGGEPLVPQDVQPSPLVGE